MDWKEKTFVRTKGLEEVAGVGQEGGEIRGRKQRPGWVVSEDRWADEKMNWIWWKQVQVNKKLWVYNFKVRNRSAATSPMTPIGAEQGEEGQYKHVATR